MEYRQLHDVYNEVEHIASTNMSRVFLATSIRNPGIWLVKQIDKQADGRQDANLMAEPEILLNVQHHALPQVIDVFEDDTSLYVVREYIKGQTLQQRMSGGKTIPEGEALAYFKQLCAVFSYLHHVARNPIIYRDCKPANIILDDAGHIYLIDFGIAKSSPGTEVGSGTRGFAAPEQYGSGASTDERTDVYGLGATIYYLLTGQMPALPASPFHTANPKANISEGMNRIVMKCLEAEPDDRYQSMAELNADLEDIHNQTAVIRTVRMRRLINIVLSIVFMAMFSVIFTTGIIRLQEENDEKYRTLLGRGYELIEDDDPLSAEEVFKDAIGMRWNSQEGYMALADLYNSRQEYGKSVDLLIQAESAVNARLLDARFYDCFGVAYYNQFDYENASECFAKASALEPEEESYLRDQAVCYAKLGRLEEADLILQRMKKNDYEKSYIRAQINEQLGRMEEAIDGYTACFDSPDVELRIDAYIAAAVVYEKKQSLANSLDHQIEILERAEQEKFRQRRITILDMLGSCYLKKADKTEGKEREQFLRLALEKIVLMKDEYIGGFHTYINIAAIYQQLGEYEGCESVLNEAVDIYGRDYRIIFRYAILELERQSKKSKNERDYTKFKEYAMEVIESSPEENESTKFLRTRLRELVLI